MSKKRRRRLRPAPRPRTQPPMTPSRPQPNRARRVPAQEPEYDDGLPRRGLPAGRPERVTANRESAAGADLRRLMARTVGSDAWRARVEDDVVVMVNEERRRNGRPPLRIDERLRMAARSHSADMKARSYFSHHTPDGRAPADRIRAAGYPSPAAENIAQGQEKPRAAMRAWMNSPGHRANILDVGVRAIGVGVELGKGGPWWTQNFGYE